MKGEKKEKEEEKNTGPNIHHLLLVVGGHKATKGENGVKA